MNQKVQMRSQWKRNQSEHGTIIQTGITFNKISCYMREPACS